MNDHLVVKPLKKGIEGLLIGLGVLIILGGLVLANFTKVMLRCRYLFVYEHFNAGDHIYLKPGFFKNDITIITMGRLIRAQNEHDIDYLNLSAEEKAELKINPALQPYVIRTHDKVVISKKPPLTSIIKQII